MINSSFSNEYEGYLLDIYEDRSDNYAELTYRYFFLMKEPSGLLNFVQDSNNIYSNLLKNGVIELDLYSDYNAMSCCMIGYNLTNGKGTSAERNLVEKLYRIHNKVNKEIENSCPDIEIENFKIKIFKMKIDLCICNGHMGDTLVPKFTIKDLFQFQELDDDSLDKFEEYFKLVQGIK